MKLIYGTEKLYLHVSLYDDVIFYDFISLITNNFMHI